MDSNINALQSKIDTLTIIQTKLQSNFYTKQLDNIYIELKSLCKSPYLKISQSQNTNTQLREILLIDTKDEKKIFSLHFPLNLNQLNTCFLTKNDDTFGTQQFEITFSNDKDDRIFDKSFTIKNEKEKLKARIDFLEEQIRLIKNNQLKVVFFNSRFGLIKSWIPFLEKNI